MSAIRRDFQGGTNKKDTESHWRSTMLAKKKSCFSIVSLSKDTTFSATKAKRLQNAKHWILRLNADGRQKPLRQRPEFAVALKQCLKMQDAHLAETRQSFRPIRPQHQQRRRQKSAFLRRRKLRILCRSQNWMAVPQRATRKPASSIFIFNFTVADFAMANELELMAAYII